MNIYNKKNKQIYIGLCIVSVYYMQNISAKNYAVSSPNLIQSAIDMTAKVSILKEVEGYTIFRNNNGKIILNPNIGATLNRIADFINSDPVFYVDTMQKLDTKVINAYDEQMDSSDDSSETRGQLQKVMDTYREKVTAPLKMKRKWYQKVSDFVKIDLGVDFKIAALNVKNWFAKKTGAVKQQTFVDVARSILDDYTQEQDLLPTKEEKLNGFYNVCLKIGDLIAKMDGSIYLRANTSDDGLADAESTMKAITGLLFRRMGNVAMEIGTEEGGLATTMLKAVCSKISNVTQADSFRQEFNRAYQAMTNLHTPIGIEPIDVAGDPTGIAVIDQTASEPHGFNPGDIIVASRTDPTTGEHSGKLGTGVDRDPYRDPYYDEDHNSGHIDNNNDHSGDYDGGEIDR